ncbi:MAG: DUF386 domain-containing protein, partial [Ignavibacteria bacterium]|nr:DUF386 domain-containing protein [Ignavibacteria bacterium]
LKGDGNFLIAEAGYFAIFFPSDVHMPCIALNLSTPVKKVVVKVKVDSYEEEQPKHLEEQFVDDKIIEETEPVEEPKAETTENPTEETNL